MTIRADSDTPASLVESLGTHPLAALGEGDPGLFRWLLVALLISARETDERALAAVAGLGRRGLDAPEPLAGADGAAVAAALAVAEVRRAEQIGPRLTRLARGLTAAGGSLDALLRRASDLEELAAGLSRLAPGLGAATLARFLAPLRERFPVAGELGADPAAVRAGLHLGWLAEGCEPASALDSLRRRAAQGEPPVALVDLEWALARLGRVACARGAARRCPARACPLRAPDGPGARGYAS